MKTAPLGLFLVASVMAQNPTGRIEGVVVDAASHQPVKKATVSIDFLDTPGTGQNQAPKLLSTDVSGAFEFKNLSAGRYRLNVVHQNYPQARMGGTHKTVQVSPGDTTQFVTIELTPGAAVSEHVVDEDGDPLSGCMVQPHPASNSNRGVPLMYTPATREDGSYRIYGIPPGKYMITARCSESVFQPRPLSEGPDPAPAAAYPTVFYPAARDESAASILDLSPGAEKSGVDFQMRPAAVTYIRGTVAAGSVDWRGRNGLRVQLVPLDRRPLVFDGPGGEIDQKDGSFEMRRVFPGSYWLTAFQQDFSARGSELNAGNRIGGVTRVDVTDKPIEVSLQLQSGVDLSGRVEIESGNDSAKQFTPSQISIRLRSENQFGPSPAPAQVGNDGSFTVKSVLPGEWRITLATPVGFLKSAWLGDVDVTGKPFDLAGGSTAPLRIVVGTKTATIRGTAPVGEVVFCSRSDGDSELWEGWSSTEVDGNGQFTLQNLAPGKYRVTVGDADVMPEEGGREISVGEGETATIEVKPEAKP